MINVMYVKKILALESYVARRLLSMKNTKLLCKLINVEITLNFWTTSFS